MFGLGRGVSMSQAGWLWADLLLGLFAIFALAGTVGGPPRAVAPAAPSARPTATLVVATPAPVPTAAAPAAASPVRPPGVDPVPLELSLPVNGAALLAGEARVVEVEQRRIAAAVAAAVGDQRVALVLAYGSHADVRTGERLAELATAALRGGAFEGAAVRTFHNLVPGDRGTQLQLSIYLYQR